MIACGSYTFDFVILLVNNDIRNVLIYDLILNKERIYLELFVEYLRTTLKCY